MHITNGKNRLQNCLQPLIIIVKDMWIRESDGRCYTSCVGIIMNLFPFADVFTVLILKEIDRG